MLGLVRAFDGQAEVFGLFLGQLGQLDPDFLEVQAGHFLVELLGQDVYAGLVEVLVSPQVEGGQRLVGEAVAAMLRQSSGIGGCHHDCRRQQR
jgi:hypothetical protein